MKCQECEVQDICGKTLSICGYCNHFEDDMQNEECIDQMLADLME